MSDREIEVKPIDDEGINRNRNIKKNIANGFLYKFSGYGLSYLVVPLTLTYLNSEKYGIWLIVLSMLTWINLMDIGFGNGLRNKLTESLSRNDLQAANEYVSTAYALISAISVAIFLVFTSFAFLLDWTKIFNVEIITNSELVITMYIIVSFFLLNFILSLSNQLYYAVQKSALAGVSTLLLNAAFLIFVIILRVFSYGNLIYLAVAYGISMTVSGGIMTFHFFRRYRGLRPAVKYVKKKRITEIYQLAGKFFVIQIASVIIFSTDNIIITQLFGPSEVTSYNIVKKLFNTVIIIQTMMLTPLWSAYTEAYSKSDFRWISSTLKKTNMLLALIYFAVLVLVFSSKLIIGIWVGDSIQISNMLIYVTAIFVLIYTWNGNYSYLLNGLGKIQVSFIAAIIGAVINIPLSILFAKHFNMGVSGVMLGTVFSLTPFAVSGPIATIKILKRKM